MSDRLTEEDVARLLSDPSVESRASLTPKLAGQIDTEGLSDRARAMAEDIIRRLSADASDLVRTTLAENLKMSPHVPRDVARQLASDIDSVSMPILEYSSVLTQDDLVELVAQASEDGQVAVARRTDLNDTVADALLDRASGRVAETIAENTSAPLGDTVLGRIADEHGSSTSVSQSLKSRPALSATVAERLVARMSDHLSKVLTERQALPESVATDLVLNARERATLSIASSEADRELLGLVEQLKRAGRLSPSLLFRAVCVGDTGFFEAGIATLASIPVHNARVLIYDQGKVAFRRLYDKAALPERLFPAFRMAVDLVNDTDMRSADFDPQSYSRMMMERVLTQASDLHPKEADYLLGRLLDIAPGTTDSRPSN